MSLDLKKTSATTSPAVAPKTLPVLIVGAGPSGLVMALQLARYSIAFRIIDKHPAPLQLSKAAAIHARTLEIFSDLGVIDRVLKEGQQVDILDLRTRYADRLRLDFSKLAHTRYPFMLDLPQYKAENILADKLAQIGISIERGVELVDLQQGLNRVEVKLRHKERSDADSKEKEEVVGVDWLVGADGAKSIVRSLCGLDFPGEAYADDWVLSDATLNWPLPRNEMTFSSSPEGIFGVFPLPGINTYRLAYTQSRDKDGKPVEPSREDVQQGLARSGIQGEVVETGEFWKFNLAHRMVKEFRKERVFLVGDAAHIHTPFGGQGMNLGIADAFNLGWKLAYVINKLAPYSLLDSYQPERVAVVRGVIKTTHLGVVTMLVRDGIKAEIRDRLLQLAGSLPVLTRQLTYNFSQLSHRYPASPFLLGRSQRLRVGERLPDQPFFDNQRQIYTRISDLVTSKDYTLLLFTGDKPQEIDKAIKLAAHVQAGYAVLVQIHLISTAFKRPENLPKGVEFWGDRGKNLTRYHNRGVTTAYLVRPDKYLGFIGTNPTSSELEAYLARVLLLPQSQRVEAVGG